MMLKSMKARFSAMMLAVVMALGVIGVANFAAVSASAAAGDTFGVGEENSATVTVTYESPQNVVSGASGQYFMYANVAGEHDLTTVSLFLRNEATYEEYYFAYAPELGHLYAQVNLTQGATYIVGTYDEAGDYTVSVYLAQRMSLGEFNGNSLYDVQLGTSLTVDLAGTHTGDYIVGVSVPDDMTHTLALSASVGGSSEPVTLTYSTEMGYVYWGQINLTGATTLTISKVGAEPLSVSITLTPAAKESDYQPIDGAFAEKTYDVGVPAYYQVTPVAKEEAEGVKEGFYTFDFSGYTLTPAEGTPENLPYEAQFSIVVKTNPNYVSAIYVSTNDQPVYLAAGETYYIELTWTSAYFYQVEHKTDEEGNPYDEYTYYDSPAVTAALSLKEWDTSKAVITPDVLNFVPVGEAGYEVTLNAGAGNYSLTLSEVPEGLSVTATYDGKDYTLNADNGYSADLIVTTVNKLTLKSTQTFVASAYLFAGEREPMTLGEAVTFTVEANGAAVYYLTDLKAGSYSVLIAGNHDVEMLDGEGVVVPAGYHYGVFTVEEDAAEYTLLFLNRSKDDTAQTVTVTIAAYEVPSIALGAESSITLAAGESKGYYLEGVTGASGYTVSLSANTNVVVSTPLTGGTVVAEGATIGGFAVEAEGEDGRVLLVFTNNGEASVTFEVTVHAAQELVLGDNTVNLTVENSVQYYYMVLPAGTYTITLDNPFIAVNVNGVLAIPLYDDTGKFTVETEEVDTEEEVTVYVAFVFDSDGNEISSTVTIALDAPVTD